MEPYADFLCEPDADKKTLDSVKKFAGVKPPIREVSHGEFLKSDPTGRTYRVYFKEKS